VINKKSGGHSIPLAHYRTHYLKLWESRVLAAPCPWYGPEILVLIPPLDDCGSLVRPSFRLSSQSDPHVSSSRPSSSTFARPTHTRARTNSQPLSWISPEDFDAASMYATPIPRPMGAGPDAVICRGVFAWSRRRLLTRDLAIRDQPGQSRSDALAAVGPRRRRRAREDGTGPAMARGGGVDAFRKGEARMPEDRDDLHPYPERKGWFDRSVRGGRVSNGCCSSSMSR
jgi:hypothetical protein